MSHGRIILDGEDVPLLLRREGPSWIVARGERSDRIEVLSAADDHVVLRVNGRRHVVDFVVDGGRIQFVWEGEIHIAESGPAARARARQRDHHSTCAPMPGIVRQILVAPGVVVRRGQPLVILEAMKMEHQITAPHDGMVRAIACSEGELVQPGIDLIALAPEAHES